MRKLLIIADRENRCNATPRGLQLAAKLGLAVDIVACTYAPLGGLKLNAADRAAVRKRLLEERSSSVQARIDKYCAPGQKPALKVVWEKDLLGWVNERCRDGRYYAVVKTGHRSESPIHTSLDWQLLRECPAPVLIVTRKQWQRERPVLASLDLASKVQSKRALNHKVLAAARQLATALDVELEIIAAIEVPVLLADLDLVDPAGYARDIREQMAPHIRELAEAHDLPQSAFTCKRGPVERVVSERANRLGAQVVVMGTVGRKGVRARLLGNTAEQVLRHLKTDILAIKP